MKVHPMKAPIIKGVAPSFSEGLPTSIVDEEGKTSRRRGKIYRISEGCMDGWTHQRVKFWTFGGLPSPGLLMKTLTEEKMIARCQRGLLFAELQSSQKKCKFGRPAREGHAGWQAPLPDRQHLLFLLRT